MGRLTESIEILRLSPKDLQNAKQKGWFTRIDPDSKQTMKLRRKLKAYKKE